MTDVVLATLAASVAMGQQEYEGQLTKHLPAAAPDLVFRALSVRSMRSTARGQARIPLRAATRVPLVLQHGLARLAYGRSRLVHRCDLRLPAARREVVTVHDLAPLRFDDEGEIPAGAATTLRRAAAIICPSHFAAGELADRFGVRAEVIPNGLNPDVWEPVQESAELVAAAGVAGRFVLHSGGATRRKNLAALAAAWPSLVADNRDLSLVLCGPPDMRRTDLFAALPRVVMLGRVPRSTLLALMSEAELVVVPSTYEGFGFPALEAMARGTAVVAADCASLPEACGDAALLVPPDADAIAKAMRRILSDDALQRRLESGGPGQARRFSWATSAQRHVEVYRTAI